MSLAKVYVSRGGDTSARIVQYKMSLDERFVSNTA
jgi:hypothetical protein